MVRLHQVLPLLAFIAFAAPAQQKAAKPPQAIYVVTYIDVYPNFADECKKLLQQFAVDSRKDAGSVRFEVLQDLSRSNHFTLIEIGRASRTSTRILHPPTPRAVREKIGPMIGAPFDERLYTIVP